MLAIQPPTVRYSMLATQPPTVRYSMLATHTPDSYEDISFCSWFVGVGNGLCWVNFMIRCF